MLKVCIEKVKKRFSDLPREPAEPEAILFESYKEYFIQKIGIETDGFLKYIVAIEFLYFYHYSILFGWR